MRPVQLDMTGFASFREETTLDFADIDYFALVGATGAGKSTVIDALTFALYGTVDRWGDKKAIRYALAPTTNQAKVRLVFDIGTSRYVVAREVRRTTQGVSQRSAVLEQLPSQHGIGAVGDAPGAVIADGSKVTDAVSKILGLSLDDFSKCVVLPQGKFSEFLNASQSQRREILLKLLGGDHYDLMARKANERHTTSTATHTTLLSQQADQPTTTQSDLDEAVTHVANLNTAADTVKVTLTEVRTALREHATTSHNLTKVRADLILLDAVSVPDDVADLARHAADSAAAEAAAAGQLDAARAADDTARHDLDAHPARRDLEIAQEHHTEGAHLTEALPGLADAAATSEKAATAAGSVRADADEARDITRQRRDTTAQEHKAATADLTRLNEQATVLRQVEVPGGVAELDARIVTADAQRATAAAACDAAEARDTAARANVKTDVSVYNGILRSLDALDEANAGLTRTTDELRQADQALEEARQTENQYQQASDKASALYADVAGRHRASDLRAHLEVGGACPVCEQQVSTLPGDLDAAELTTARTAQQEALAALKQAQPRAATAAQHQLTLSVQTRSATEHRNRLLTELGDPTPDRASIEADLETARQAQNEAKDAAAAYAAARTALQSAQNVRQALDEQHQGARTALRSARRPLAALPGCPDVDDTSVAQGWQSLYTWASATLAELESTLLPAARRTQQDAATAVDDALAADTAAQSAYTGASRAYDQATSAVHRANENHRAANDRLHALSAVLASAPSPDAIVALLADRARAETAAQQSTTALRHAEQAARDATGTARAARDAMGQAHRDLASARDPLVSLGAPTIHDTALDQAWTLLADWAHDRQGSLAATAQQLQAAQQQSQQAVTTHLELIRDTLRTHGVDAAQHATAAGGLVDDADLGGISSALEVAKVRAAQRVGEYEQHLAKAAELATRVEAAAEEKDVAALLAKLLSAGHFRDWLASTALDTLVAQASDSLRELSGGQYDLTQRNNEFHVIDHFDADSYRPVRTLSGGETFQASLALALALSGQMSALAAGGTAHLDSIFLDEGFGTLDPDALDLVASTLETLSQGRRMVGVVTHVTALAERAPVRFHVTRDGRTSSVTKESQ